MGAPSDVTLKTTLRLNAVFTYKRIDKTLNDKSLSDRLVFNKINHLFTNGAGKDQNNLLYYATRRLINSTELLDLDGVLVDSFNQTLNYDAIHTLIFYNNETAVDRYLEVAFKNERYYIGPGGSRTIVEPATGGIEAIVSSASAEEGNITVSSNADVTYDIIIAGSHAESSSSSGA